MSDLTVPRMVPRWGVGVARRGSPLVLGVSVTWLRLTKYANAGELLLTVRVGVPGVALEVCRHLVREERSA